MTCLFCSSDQISFSYCPDSENEISLCQDHRHSLFKALFYDYWKSGFLGQMVQEFLEKGPRSIDMPPQTVKASSP